MEQAITNEIRVLGPFGVWIGDQPLRVGPGKQRLLLATLALHANQVVSADRLVDVLWDDAPPEDAYRTVQKYVYRLRGVISGAANGHGDASLRVETQPAGYVLVPGDVQLDADRFVWLVGEARRISDGDPIGAIARFGDALADFSRRSLV